LGRKFEMIITDCEAVLDRCEDPLFRSQVTFVRAAIAAVRDGHHAAGQALVTNLMDSMLWTLLPAPERQKITGNRRGSTSAALDDLELREAYVMLPIWSVHEAFWRYHGDPIPHTYKRHASVHAVSTRQFNKRNTVQALMVATSLVGFACGL